MTSKGRYSFDCARCGLAEAKDCIAFGHCEHRDGITPVAVQCANCGFMPATPHQQGTECTLCHGGPFSSKALVQDLATREELQKAYIAGRSRRRGILAIEQPSEVGKNQEIAHEDAAPAAGGVFVLKMTEGEARKLWGASHFGTVTGWLRLLHKLGLLIPEKTPLEIAKEKYSQLDAAIVEDIVKIAGARG